MRDIKDWLQEFYKKHHSIKLKAQIIAVWMGGECFKLAY